MKARPNTWLLADDLGYLQPVPRPGWVTTFGDGTKPPVTLYVFPRHVGHPPKRTT